MDRPMARDAQDDAFLSFGPKDRKGDDFELVEVEEFCRRIDVVEQESALHCPADGAPAGFLGCNECSFPIYGPDATHLSHPPGWVVVAGRLLPNVISLNEAAGRRIKAQDLTVRCALLGVNGLVEVEVARGGEEAAALTALATPRSVG
jgi:hypothetical protein